MSNCVDPRNYREKMYVLYWKASLCDANSNAWRELADYVANILSGEEKIYSERYLVQNTKVLLKLGLSVSDVNCSVFTRPIIEIGEESHVKKLLEGGVSVDSVDGKGTSVFQLAQGRLLGFLEENIKSELFT